MFKPLAVLLIALVSVSIVRSGWVNQVYSQSGTCSQPFEMASVASYPSNTCNDYSSTYCDYENSQIIVSSYSDSECTDLISNSTTPMNHCKKGSYMNCTEEAMTAPNTVSVLISYECTGKNSDPFVYELIPMGKCYEFIGYYDYIKCNATTVVQAQYLQQSTSGSNSASPAEAICTNQNYVDTHFFKIGTCTRSKSDNQCYTMSCNY